MKRTITLLGLAGILASTPAMAGGVSEVSAGNESVTIDVKASRSLPAPVDDLSLFTRGRVGFDYEGSTSLFGVSNLVYSPLAGLGLVGRVDIAPGDYVDPRVGAQYAHSFGDAKVFNQLTYGFDQETVLHIGSVSGVADVGEHIDLFMGIETLTSFHVEDGFAFGVQRLRLGPSYENMSFGGMCDLREANGDVTYNCGGFLRVGE